MFGRIWVSSLLALAVVMAGAPAASAYSPNGGSIFNNPFGTNARQYAIQNHFRKSIASTRRGDVIRISTWRLNDGITTTKLIRAHRRGVDVRMLIHNRGKQVRRLRQVVGSRRSARSFVYNCRHGCRTSRASSLHSKFMLFSSAGRSNKVVMVSSSNLTHQHATQGWNDVYTVVGRPGMYGFFKSVFYQMAQDHGYRNPYRVQTVDRFRAYVFPRRGTTAHSDTIYHELMGVRCSGARGGAGERGKTAIRVAMFNWRGARGEKLARKLVNLDDAGCIVRVIYGAPTARVASILKRRTSHGGIALYDSRRDSNNNGVADKYVHMKCLMISGHVRRDRSSWKVYTGSANWTREALRYADEVILRISGGGPHKRYKVHWNDMARKSRPVGRRTAGFQADVFTELKMPESN
ncbi:MAG: phospholipase D-like domain-containing protein [Nocardioidaceae bacterium]